MATDSSAETERATRPAHRGDSVSYANRGKWRVLKAVRRGRRWVFAPETEQDELALNLHGIQPLGVQSSTPVDGDGQNPDSDVVKESS